MSYTFKKDVDQKTYDDFVKNSPHASLLQSYSWADIKDNWDHLHTGVEDENGNLQAAGLVLIKRLPMNFSMFYLPRGPIMDYKNKELLKFYIDELKKTAKEYNCLFIKMDPEIHINDYPSSQANQDYYPDMQEYMDSFKNAGAIHQGFTTMISESIQPRYISVVYDKENFEDELPRHTRRLIKDSEKKNVEVIHGGKELVDDFSRLVAMTEARKGIALRNHDYFEKLMETYGNDAVIFLARVDLHSQLNKAKEQIAAIEKDIAATPENAKKKLRRLQEQLASQQKKEKEFSEIIEREGIEPGNLPIAGILSIKYGPVCEMLYAGMDERFSQFMPQYKEYVENFKWGFENGCTRASMGGVEGTLDDGLTKFKDNFNPLIAELIGEFDVPVNKLLYKASKKAYDMVKSKGAQD